eukprot:TRINITY_DN5556_c0_g2_i1.p1 TRINITY_DN5556_c0_g2~~TRINITY_DN5556_c0_g2_i1.p1  ORF type:complete len:613 (+),score=207.05 TRINITY_DN5556_c0_g2_i1:119-1957(+)
MASVFASAKKGIKAKAYDAEGHEVEFDVRDDEEQSVKLNQTVDLLLAAGYFRARIKGLAPFDKVVGGMVWCITASNVDVNVDLLFQENSTIGQKIALTEKIVAVLPRMKCPHRIEPHQIQGLDFVHIYPVVQWLVKKAFETREERARIIRDRAIFAFKQHDESPEMAETEAELPKAITATRSILEQYGPKRAYKAPTSARDEETRVQTTLLEYGKRYGLRRKAAPKDDKQAAAAASLGGEEEAEAAQAEEERHIDALLGKMTQAGEGDVDKSRIGSILETDAISKLTEEYQAHAAQQAAADDSRKGGAVAHKRAVSTLTKQLEAVESELATVQAQRDVAAQEHAQAQQQLDQALEKQIELDAEARRLDEAEGDENNKPIIAKLRHLLDNHDGIKQQLADFKTTCGSEMERLTQQIDQLKSQGVEHIDDERAKAVRAQFEEESAKLDKARVIVGRRNRKIAYLERKLDSVPSRGELKQYQRRFVELYEQINAKHRETQDYYALYNTLADTLTYSKKEHSLLESISETFPKAMQSSGNRKQFLEQLSNIVEGINTNKAKLQEQHEAARSNRDALSESFLDLVEQERLYHKKVKEYEKDMAKNAELEKRVAARQA